MPSEMKRLKKLVADLSLGKEMLQDVIRRKLCSVLGPGRRSIIYGRCYSFPAPLTPAVATGDDHRVKSSAPAVARP